MLVVATEIPFVPPLRLLVLGDNGQTLFAEIRLPQLLPDLKLSEWLSRCRALTQGL